MNNEVSEISKTMAIACLKLSQHMVMSSDILFFLTIKKPGGIAFKIVHKKREKQPNLHVSEAVNVKCLDISSEWIISC